MEKEKINGVIKNNDDSWERNGIEELKKSSVEEAIDYYFNIYCEEINIVAKALSIIPIIPKINGVSISFKSLGYVSKDTREIVIDYNNSNLGFVPKEINILDQSVLNDNGVIKIFNKFYYNLLKCSNIERLQSIAMLEEYFSNYIKSYDDFPGIYIKSFKYVKIKIFDGKIVIYISRHKKSLKKITDLI